MKAARFSTIALGVLLYAVAVSAALFRIFIPQNRAGSHLGAQWALIDFQSNQYYPVRALLEGQNPYDAVAHYPVSQGTMPYAPLNLLLHLPFGLVAPDSAAIAYFVFIALLTLLLAGVTLRLARVTPTAERILFLSAALLLTRPGHWSLLLGQTAIPLTLVTYVVLLDESRTQVRAGLGVFVDLIKVTFGVPLAVLLWAYGRRRAVLIGMGLSVLVNLPLLLLLSRRVGGMNPLLDSMLSAVRANQEAAESSVVRIDATSFVSRLLGSPLSVTAQVMLAVGLLLASATVVHLLAQRKGDTPRDVVIGIICIATSLTGYHIGYDAILLLAPLVTVIARGVPGGRHRLWRPVFLILFLVPAVNWLASEGAIAALRPSHATWLLITSLNSFSLLALLFGYLWLGLQYHSRSALAPATDLAAYAPSTT